jgi:hypothetical protein
MDLNQVKLQELFGQCFELWIWGETTSFIGVTTER